MCYASFIGVLTAQHLSIVARPRLHWLVSYPTAPDIPATWKKVGPGLGQVHPCSRNISSKPIHIIFRLVPYLSTHHIEFLTSSSVR